MGSELENPNPSARIMTFHPTVQEFKNFSRYIAYIESQGAHRAGLAKIVPPKEWKPRKWYDDIDDLVIPAPIQQVVTGQSGLFTQYNIQKKAMSVREFRRIANNDKYCTPRYTDFEDLERKYWKNLTFNAPIYGADVNGTLYDKHVDEWNIGHLNTILDIVENESGITIEGVNTPYLYFGMWKTSFAWHTEDMDLYSINYLHFGEPKSWYSIPPEHGKRLERLAKGFFPGSAQSCEAFLRHKMTLISPSILKKYGIPFDKVTQEAGEFMITFPYGYHAGFNHGFNCAESTNFATLRWIEYGKQSVLCSCRKDMVKISMEVFVRKYQPDRYKLWKAGKDVTVIDHTLPTPEASEFFKGELLQKVKNEKQCPEETETEEECKADEDMEKKNKRHRVCLEVPHEVSQSESFPKEEVVPVQFEIEEADPPVGLAREPVQQGDEGLAPPEYADSSEVKFEELKNVKLEEEEEEEEEEEPESAVLDLSISHSVSSVLTQSIMKSSPVSSFQSSSSFCSGSSDSEPPDLSRQLVEQTEVLTVHSYAKEEVNVMEIEQPSRKKTSSTAHVDEQELAKADCGSQSLQAVPNATNEKMKTKPLIPEMCFTTTGCSTDVSLSTPYLEEDGTSVLITCKHCQVRVHASCYGVAPEKATEDWKCSRCKANALEELMLSNKLVMFPWSDAMLVDVMVVQSTVFIVHSWVHVMCAVAVVEAKFINIAQRSPVDVSKIPLQRFRLKCVFCKKRRKRIAGCCVQCSHGRCPTSFHVSCAQAAGVMMQPDDWPFVVFITCFRHKIPSQAERAKAGLQDLAVGQPVISKHKNGRFYQCEVVNLTKETFYEVNFDDGSFSDNLYPEDIVSRDCLQLGPPPPGEVVQVRWTDGQVYGATFVASHVIQMYQVEFEDGSQLMAKRDDVYTLDEELPKRVKSRLSVASDMRFTEIFAQKEVKQERKRQRVINSRYREDYIEPALYRAIME
ncbi:Lysine-specific demethylase 4A [Ophiophagus hannah]|uniref:Lysine-specific demethylase 4A n=1 Tax=Ophiophagus hannah TaxID=8665 RepID=V8NSD4_OPHHA|nr:Lysine-specific demethylase 4A [Ophiophagus hannah]